MHRYRCIDYFDVWGNPTDGFEVNNLSVVEDGILLDPVSASDRELYRIFCGVTGYNPRLRAVEVVGDYDYFIEFAYTAARVGGYYPLGRFERTD